MKTSRWTKETLGEAFDRYHAEYGRYPTWKEIDRCPYLPSTRTIQRRIGGLVEFRKILGLENPNYATGKKRSEIGIKSNEISKEVELKAKSILVGRFGEVSVHREEPISDGSKTRYDFVVYLENGKIGIDVFYSDELHDINKNIYMKIRNSYKNLSIPTYFVLANNKYSQRDLDLLIGRRKTELPKLVRLVSWDGFLASVKGNFAENQI